MIDPFPDDARGCCSPLPPHMHKPGHFAKPLIRREISVDLINPRTEL